MNPEILEALPRLDRRTKMLLLTMDKVSRGFPLTEEEALHWLEFDSVSVVSNDPIAVQTTEVALSSVDLSTQNDRKPYDMSRLKTLNSLVLGISAGQVCGDLGVRYVRAVMRAAPLHPLLNSTYYLSKGYNIRDLAIEEVERRATEDPSFRQQVASDEHFVVMYRKVLELEMTRSVTRFFAEIAGDQNKALDDVLLAHAFPNYPEVTEAIKGLAMSSNSDVLNSPNFANHYERLVLKPHMDSIPHVSIQLLGRIKDSDLMWKYLYRRLDSSSDFLQYLATSYQPDGAFAKAPLLERVDLSRRRSQYLRNLFTRALRHGEVQDEVLDGAGSKNVTRLLLETAAKAPENQIELLKETAPVVAAMVLAYRASH